MRDRARRWRRGRWAPLADAKAPQHERSDFAFSCRIWRGYERRLAPLGKAMNVLPYNDIEGASPRLEIEVLRFDPED